MTAGFGQRIARGLDLDGDLDAVVGGVNADYWALDRNGDNRTDVSGYRPLNSPSRVYLNDGKGRTGVRVRARQYTAGRGR